MLPRPRSNSLYFYYPASYTWREYTIIYVSFYNKYLFYISILSLPLQSTPTHFSLTHPFLIIQPISRLTIVYSPPMKYFIYSLCNTDFIIDISIHLVTFTFIKPFTFSLLLFRVGEKITNNTSFH